MRSGIHQLARPKRYISDGTRTRRMTNASNRTALARPRPNSQAVADGCGGVLAVLPFLVHAGNEEDLVVHRQPEDDREQEHGHERLDRTGGADADQRSEVPLLEDPGDHAERRADAQQVHERGLYRDHDRAEHDGEQQQREADDDHDEQRQLRRERVVEVCRQGGGSADARMDRRLGIDGRHDVVSQSLEQVGGGLVLRLGSREHRGDRGSCRRTRRRHPRRSRRRTAPIRSNRSTTHSPSCAAASPH